MVLTDYPAQNVDSGLDSSPCALHHDLLVLLQADKQKATESAVLGVQCWSVQYESPVTPGCQLRS